MKTSTCSRVFLGSLWLKQMWLALNNMEFLWDIFELVRTLMVDCVSLARNCSLFEYAQTWDENHVSGMILNEISKYLNSIQIQLPQICYLSDLKTLEKICNKTVKYDMSELEEKITK